MANRKGYQAIEAEAGHVGWPIAYYTDLIEHDLALLDEQDSLPEFGWVLREHGTHLFYPFRGEMSLDWARAISRDTAARFYWYDGESLRQVPPKKWLGLLGRKE